MSSPPPNHPDLDNSSYGVGTDQPFELFGLHSTDMAERSAASPGYYSQTVDPLDHDGDNKETARGY